MSNEVRRYYYVYKPPKTEGGGVSKDYVDRQVAEVLAHANGLETTIKTAVKTEIDNELATTIPNTVSAKFLEKKGEILQEIGDNHFLYEDIGNLNKNAVIALYPNENYCTFSNHTEPKTLSSLTGFNIEGVTKLHDNTYLTTTGSIRKDLNFSDLSTLEFSVFLVAEINVVTSNMNELFSIYKSTGTSNERIAFFMPWGSNNCMIDPLHVNHRQIITIPDIGKYTNKTTIVHITFRAGKLNFWLNDDHIVADRAITIGSSSIPSTGAARMTIDAFKLSKLYGFYLYKDGSIDVKKVLMKRYLQDMEFVGRRLIGVSDPIKNKDAINKEYMESHTTTIGGNYMLKSAPDAGGNRIQNVADPIDITDSVNKRYMEQYTTTLGAEYISKTEPDAGNNKIKNVGDPTEAKDAVNKQYLESHTTTVGGEYMLKSAPDAGGNKIVNVGNPVLTYDAANKRYVDETIGGKVSPIDIDRDSIPVGEIDIYPHPSKATGTTPVTAIEGGFSVNGTVDLVINYEDNRDCYHNYHYDTTSGSYIHKTLTPATFNTNQFTYYLIFNSTYAEASPYTMFIKDPNNEHIRISLHWVWSDNNIYVDCFNVTGGRITINRATIINKIADGRTLVLCVNVKNGRGTVYLNSEVIASSAITATFSNPIPTMEFRAKDTDRLYGFYFYKTAHSTEMIQHLNEYLTNRYNTRNLVINKVLKGVVYSDVTTDGASVGYVESKMQDLQNAFMIRAAPDAGGNRIQNVADPTAAKDAVNKQYLESHTTTIGGSYMLKSAPDAGGNKITNVGDPVDNTDATNKQYLTNNYMLKSAPDAANNKIINVGDPTSAKDAVNKGYMESHTANLDFTNFNYKTLHKLGVTTNVADASNAINLGNNCFRVINANVFDGNAIVPELNLELTKETDGFNSSVIITKVNRFNNPIKLFTLDNNLLKIKNLPEDAAARLANDLHCTLSFYMNTGEALRFSPSNLRISLVDSITFNRGSFIIDYEQLVNGLYDSRVTSTLGVGGTTIDVNPFDHTKFMHVIGIEKTSTTFRVDLNGTQFLLEDLLNTYNSVYFDSIVISTTEDVYLHDISFYDKTPIRELTLETSNYWDNLGRPYEILDTNLDLYYNKPYSEGLVTEKTWNLDITNDSPGVISNIDIIVSFTPRNSDTMVSSNFLDGVVIITLAMQKEDSLPTTVVIEATRSYVSTKVDNTTSYIYGPQLGVRALKLNYVGIRVYIKDDLSLGLEVVGNGLFKLSSAPTLKLKSNIMDYDGSSIYVKNVSLNYLAYGRSQTKTSRDLFMSGLLARNHVYTDFFQLSSIYLSSQIFSSVTAVNASVVTSRLPRFYLPKHIDKNVHTQYQVIGLVRPRGGFTTPPAKMLFYDNTYKDADGDRGNRKLELDFSTKEANGDILYKSLDGIFLGPGIEYLALWLWQVTNNLVLDIYLDFYIPHFSQS